MKQARFDRQDGGGVYGEIPGCPGVWAEAVEIDECRRELQEVLEEWIVLKLRDGDVLPVVDGIDLVVRAA